MFTCIWVIRTKGKTTGIATRITVTTDKYKCNAKLGVPAGDGGLGGCGGTGGNPGTYSVIGLMKSPEIEVLNYTGKNVDYSY